MNDKKILKDLLFESIQVLSIVNELLKIETMDKVDYSDILEDLKWCKVMLNNRLVNLKGSNYKSSNWVTAHQYLDKVDGK